MAKLRGQARDLIAQPRKAQMPIAAAALRLANKATALKPHIATRVAATLLSDDDHHYVLVTVSVQNRGRLALHIEHEYTGVALFAAVPAGIRFRWVDFDAFDALLDETIIEASVETESQYIVPLPRAPMVPLRVDFVLQGKASWRKRAPRWTASCVLIPNVRRLEQDSSSTAG